jgi:hypothetical protein
MRRKHILVAVAAMLALTATASAAIGMRGTSRSDLAAARAATAAYRDVGRATAAGYAEFKDANKVACIELAGEGGMGVHYVKGELVGNPALDPRTPEALVYEPRGKKLQLVALEYIVMAEAWTQPAPPAMFGRTFDYVPAGNRYGLPAFWALHAWIWKRNPTGTVMAWNPKVDCPS